MSIRFVVAAACALFAASAQAQLALRQSEVAAGGYSTVGNMLIDCPTAATCNNNDAVMVAIDVDSVLTTTISSSATLELPLAAVVRTAFLYVYGSGTETVAGTTSPPWVTADPASFTVEFAPPLSSYVSLLPLDVLSSAGDTGYLARYDVSALVTGSGEYFVANARMIPATHPFNRILSWVLFVTYDDGSPPVLINLYDGSLPCFMGTTTINLAGFRTPAAVSPAAQFTAWSVDGHPSIVGESITVGTTMVSNAQNPSNNIGNATVSSPSGPITRNPSSFRVTEEMDLDTFDVSSAFTTSQTSVDIAFTCGNLEGVIYQMAVLGVEVVAPILEVEKTVVDLNGGTVVAGDELSYELTVRTTGGDDAIDVVLSDVLPAGLSYVASSIEYIAPVLGAKTDQPGDDEAEWTGSELVFRVGSGATATHGGTIAVGLDQLVRFRARVDTATVARTIVNRASVSARGAQGGSGATVLHALSSTVGVEALPCVGFENGQCPDAGVNADAEAPDAGDAGEDAGSIERDAETESDAVASDAIATDAGVTVTDAAPADAAPAPDAAALADASALADAGAPVDNEENGCGCSTTPRPAGADGLALLLALLIFSARAVFRRQ